MKTVLVLGGGGFLGDYIARHFASEGARIVAVGRSASPNAHVHAAHAWTLPHAGLGELVARERPALCVNAAGSASVPRSMTEPLADFENGTALTFRVLDDLRRHSPETAFINISSAAVYGDPDRLPVSEAAPANPISPYGWHKRMTETVVEEFCRLFGLRGCSLRLFSAYGPGLRRQVVWDLTQRVLAQRGGPLVLHGRADSRDFIHGSDVAMAVALAAQNAPLQGECYNVAAGVETPIRDLAALIQRSAGQTESIAFDESPQPGNPGRWHADISRLKALGFAAQVDLEAGVAEMIAQSRELNAQP